MIDLTINLAKDPDNPKKVIASTIATDGTAYIVGGLAVDYVIIEILIGTALAITGVATAAVAATTYLGGMAKDFLYHTTYNGINGIENFDFYSPEIIGTITKDKFIAKSASNDPNFCMNIFPEYINYRQIVKIESGSESFLYNQLTKDATITISQNEKDVTETVLKNTDADKLTINSQTLDIRNLSTLELRNAIDGINADDILKDHNGGNDILNGNAGNNYLDGEQVTVDFQTADNTATASYDYASTQKSITFTKDSMTQTVEVAIYDDSYKESNEIFLFRLCMNANRINYLEREIA